MERGRRALGGQARGPSTASVYFFFRKQLRDSGLPADALVGKLKKDNLVCASPGHDGPSDYALDRCPTRRRPSRMRSSPSTRRGGIARQPPPLPPPIYVYDDALTCWYELRSTQNRGHPGCAHLRGGGTPLAWRQDPYIPERTVAVLQGRPLEGIGGTSWTYIWYTRPIRLPLDRALVFCVVGPPAALQQHPVSNRTSVVTSCSRGKRRVGRGTSRKCLQ